MDLRFMERHVYTHPTSSDLRNFGNISNWTPKAWKIFTFILGMFLSNLTKGSNFLKPILYFFTHLHSFLYNVLGHSESCIYSTTKCTLSCELNQWKFNNFDEVKYDILMFLGENKNSENFSVFENLVGFVRKTMLFLKDRRSFILQQNVSILALLENVADLFEFSLIF